MLKAGIQGLSGGGGGAAAAAQVLAVGGTVTYAGGKRIHDFSSGGTLTVLVSGTIAHTGAGTLDGNSAGTNTYTTGVKTVSGAVNATYDYTNNLQTSTGGIISYENGWRIHEFLSSGTLTPSGAGLVDYLCAAGGGGGGDGPGGNAGGGGAGGHRTNEDLIDFAVVASGLTVTVGDGGAGATTASTSGAKGNNSVFDSITSEGGAPGQGNLSTDDISGGSGGGGGFTQTAGGAGNDGTPSPDEGNDGGAATSGGGFGGGGGGGRDAVGAANASGGAGGAGKANDGNWGAAAATLAGGGGGGAQSGGGGAGGAGGGGAGGSASVGTAGTANTGGGGGGGTDGAAGGSGVVGVRYPQALVIHRYWRARYQNGGGGSGYFEVELHSDAGEVAVASGMISFGAGFGDQNAGQLTDGDTGTLGFTSGAPPSVDDAITIDLGASGGQPITKWRFRVNNQTNDWDIDWSDNGSDWTEVVGSWAIDEAGAAWVETTWTL